MSFFAKTYFYLTRYPQTQRTVWRIWSLLITVVGQLWLISCLEVSFSSKLLNLLWISAHPRWQKLASRYGSTDLRLSDGCREVLIYQATCLSHNTVFDCDFREMFSHSCTLTLTEFECHFKLFLYSKVLIGQQNLGPHFYTTCGQFLINSTSWVKRKNWSPFPFG